MCNNESLQQKAYKTAVFHISLSLVGFLFLIYCFLDPEINDFVYKAICNETTTYSNGSLKHQTTRVLMKKYISMVENGCNHYQLINSTYPYNRSIT